MFKRLILNSTLLCISICLLSACVTREDPMTSIRKQMYEAHKAKKLAENQEEIARLSPEQLALQSMPPDTLIGKACNNNFNFEIKITEGKAKNFRFILGATLTGNSQSNLQFQTLLSGELSNNILRFNAYTAPSKSQKISSLQDDSGLSRNLRMFLIKDSKEIGWEGTIEGDNFSVCDDLTLTSTTGKYASMFPSEGKLKEQDFSFVLEEERGYLTDDMFGSGKSNVLRKKFNGPIVRLYWLKRMLAFDEAYLHHIGKAYEELGQTTPENYSLALQAYHNSAEKFDSLGSYEALSRMYSLGLGTKADPIKSKKLSEYVQSEINTATGACLSPEVIEKFKSKWQKINGKNRSLGGLSNLVTGSNSDMGELVITKIAAGNLSSLNKPFLCVASIQRINIHTDMGVPDYKLTMDSSGRIFAYDNSINKLASTFASAALDNLLSKIIHTDTIPLHPLGNDRYIIGGERQENSFVNTYKRNLAKKPKNENKDIVRAIGKSNNLLQESSSKQELPHQKEQQDEQNLNIEGWAKDYFNKK